MAVSKRPWPLQRMAELETRHQRLCMAAYNGLGKPKHHHRMHISSQGTHLQLLVTTDAGEAKHQQYKGALSEFCQHLTDKTQLAQSVSAHMLMGQMNRLAQHDPFLKGLRASPKEDGEVLAWLPQSMWISKPLLPRVSAEAATELMHVARGDVLRELPLARRSAAVLASCVWCGQLCFRVRMLKFVAEDRASSTWTLLQREEIWSEQRIDCCFRPSWWHQAGNAIICLA